MSFSRIISRKALPLTRTRLFTTTPLTRKSAIDTAKETIEDLNKKAGQSAAAGIEKGQQATQSAKQAVGINASKAEGSAKEMTGEAKGKAQEMTGEAKGKAQEMTGGAKGKASEVAGQAKGKAEEVKEKM